MSAYPTLSTQVIGQTESALGAILDPLLARVGTTFNQWLVLAVTAASGTATTRAQLVTRITSARKIDDSAVLAALPGDGSQVGLTSTGQARHRQIRTAVEEVTARLFADLPAEDLATAGRVLAIITARANAEL